MGEVFGDLPTWSEETFTFPLLPGSRRAPGTYRLPDRLRLLDLDDPAVRDSARALGRVLPA